MTKLPPHRLMLKADLKKRQTLIQNNNKQQKNKRNTKI